MRTRMCPRASSFQRSSPSNGFGSAGGKSAIASRFLLLRKSSRHSPEQFKVRPGREMICFREQDSAGLSAAALSEAVNSATGSHFELLPWSPKRDRVALFTLLDTLGALSESASALWL